MKDALGSLMVWIGEWLTETGKRLQRPLPKDDSVIYFFDAIDMDRARQIKRRLDL